MTRRDERYLTILWEMFFFLVFFSLFFFLNYYCCFICITLFMFFQEISFLFIQFNILLFRIWQQMMYIISTDDNITFVTLFNKTIVYSEILVPIILAFSFCIKKGSHSTKSLCNHFIPTVSFVLCTNIKSTSIKSFRSCKDKSERERAISHRNR